MLGKGRTGHILADFGSPSEGLDKIFILHKVEHKVQVCQVSQVCALHA